MTRVKGKPEKTGGKLVVPEYDDVIVYSMGKVASSSISMALSDAGVRCYDIHTLASERLKVSIGWHVDSPDYLTIPLNLLQSIEAYNACQVVDKISIITPIREPIFRNISAVFQSAPRKLSDKKIMERLKKYNPIVPDYWFKSDFIPATGIDVLNMTHDKSQNSFEFENDKFRVLILKTEATDDEKSAIISNFLGKAVKIKRVNIGGNKWYSELYGKIKSNIDVMGPDFVEKCIELDYFRAFYSDVHIKSLLRNVISDEAYIDRLLLEKPDATQVPNTSPIKTSAAGSAPAANVVNSDATAKKNAMTISAITPSYNQAEFLPECLETVWAQSRAPIEHLVYDPGSSDGSRDIVKKHPKSQLIAEPDKGQSDAISRGMTEAKGDIIAWINSDDYYPNSQVFAQVAAAFEADDNLDIVYGRGVYVGKNNEYLRDAYVVSNTQQLPWRLHKEVGILQPATFIRRRLIEKIGILREDLNFCMDYEFWIRAQKSGAKFKFIDKTLACARYYSDNKTMGARDKSLREVIEMLKENFKYAHIDWIRRYAECLLYENDGILNNVNQSDTEKVDNISALTYRLNRDFNGDHKTTKYLIRRKDTNIIRTTANTLLKDRESLPVAYCQKLPIETKTFPNHKCYTVGPQRWAFKRNWRDAELQRTNKFVESFRKNRTSDTCIVVGNGPSLKETDLDLLEGHTVFISNFAVMNDRLRELATFLSVTNYLVAEQGGMQFNELDGVKKLYPYWLSYCLLPSSDTYYFNSVGRAEFSKDYADNVSWRSTVTFFHLQMAFALGFKKVLLIGVDNTYTQPKNVIEGDVIEQVEDDLNHFDPSYFKGKKWQAADTGNMSDMYQLSKAAFESEGREIVNCTVGGKLELFRRSSLSAELLND